LNTLKVTHLFCSGLDFTR